MKTAKYTEIASIHKAILSRLLADENITVEFQNVDTAHFELKNRTLVLPNMKEGLPECLYNLFTGHECGHALETPAVEWEYLIQNKIVSQTILNIVEDVRIEKIIKQRYPGIRKDFFDGYKELLSRNFFGIKFKDVNLMNFLDRLNIYAKCGPLLVDIYFSPEELVFVKECEDAETWDQVVDISKRIYAFMKSKKKTVKDGDIKDPSKKSDKPDQSSGRKSESGDEMLNDVLDDEPNSAGNPSGPKKMPDGVDNSIESETQKQMDKMLQSLIDKNSNDIINAYMPQNINSKRYIIHWSEFVKSISEIVMDTEYNYYSYYNSYLALHKNSISFMYQEFQLRKKAIEFQKSKITKTGNLNPNRLFSYKFSENLFRSNEIVSEGQSHGMVFVVDWSGSMTDDMKYTIQQLFCVTDFCRKCNIPFEVYCFTEQVSCQRQLDQTSTIPKENELYITPFNMVNILSSQMGMKDYIETQKKLLHIIYSRLYAKVPNFSMGGTPLNEAIVVTMDIVSKFKVLHNLEIVNVVFLTDGQGTELGTSHGCRSLTGEKVYIHDPITKKSYKVNEKTQKDQKNILLQILKERTGANVLGFFIVDDLSCGDLKKYSSSFGKNASTLFNTQYYVSVDDIGYDKFFVLNKEGFKDKNLKPPTIDSNMLDSFRENQQFDYVMRNSVMKNRSRVMLRQFIDVIS